MLTNIFFILCLLSGVGFFYFLYYGSRYFNGNPNKQTLAIVFFFLMMPFFLFLAGKYSKPVEFVEKICGTFEFDMPKASQKVTNKWYFIFNIDGYGDLKLPLSEKFNMNGVNKKKLNRGDRVCMLILMEKDEPDNLRKVYSTVDMWFEES